ncbi:MAG: hypothetical protein P1P81_07060 [Desulfobulbales bacterium]|nr:hypothetical protein [Desulfobulbales bacterium]
MKKSYLLVGVSLVLALAIGGCKSDVEESRPAGETPEIVSPAPGISGKVTETMDASGYTYAAVDTGSETIWVAGPKTQLQVGDEVYVPEGAPINNFESKTLGRTFETILFASSIMVGGADQAFATAGEQGSAGKAAAAAASSEADLDFSDLTKAENGKTVEEIFAEKAALNGEAVKVRGKVTKFMSGIMGKNWLHLKDGSGAAGSDDLVVTTMASANVGDTVLINGTVAADKDFGSGYRYDVIVEDAEVTVE